MEFHQTALTLREEFLARGAAESQKQAEMFDVCGIIGIRYGLRVVGLHTEFYRRAAKDPLHARLVMPVLEGKNQVPASGDLYETLKTLEGHISTQLVKAVASLNATNATKRKGKDGPAGAK